MILAHIHRSFLISADYKFHIFHTFWDSSFSIAPGLWQLADLHTSYSNLEKSPIGVSIIIRRSLSSHTLLRQKYCQIGLLILIIRVWRELTLLYLSNHNQAFASSLLSEFRGTTGSKTLIDRETVTQGRTGSPAFGRTACRTLTHRPRSETE